MPKLTIVMISSDNINLLKNIYIALVIVDETGQVLSIQR